MIIFDFLIPYSFIIYLILFITFIILFRQKAIYSRFIFLIVIITFILVIIGLDKFIDQSLSNYKIVRTDIDKRSFSYQNLILPVVNDIIKVDDGYLVIGNETILESSVNDKIYKLDIDMNLLWTKELTSSEDYLNKNIVEVSDEKYIVSIGERIIKLSSNGEVIFDKTMDEFNIFDIKETSNGFVAVGEKTDTNNCSKGYISSYDLSGKQIWGKILESSDSCSVSNATVEVSKDGGIIASIIDQNNKMLLKYDNTGIKLWEKVMEDSILDITSIDNNIITVGYQDFDEIYYEDLSHSEKYQTQYAIINYINPIDGEIKWQKQFGGGASLYSFNSVIINKESIIAAGSYKYSSNYRSYIVKYTLDGDKIWETHGLASESIKLLHLNQGDYLLIGELEGEDQTSYNGYYKFSDDTVTNMVIDNFDNSANNNNRFLVISYLNYYKVESIIKYISLAVIAVLLIIKFIIYSPIDAFKK